MQLYINSLQKRVIKNPQLWFNFYDYWDQDVKICIKSINLLKINIYNCSSITIFKEFLCLKIFFWD